MVEKVQPLDTDRDGKIENEDFIQKDKIVDIEIKEEKAHTQKRMAYIALLTMCLVTLLLVSPIVPIERVEVLGAVLDLFYIAQAGIVGTYMGVTAWVARKR